MDKLAAGPALADHVALEGGVAYNIEQAMHVLDCEAGDVRIVALDRERHAGLFEEILTPAHNFTCLEMAMFQALSGRQDDGPFDMLMGIGQRLKASFVPPSSAWVGCLRADSCSATRGRSTGRHDEDDDLTRLWKADLCKSEGAIFAASAFAMATCRVSRWTPPKQPPTTNSSMLPRRPWCGPNKNDPFDSRGASMAATPVDVRLPQGHWAGDVTGGSSFCDAEVETPRPLSKGRGTARCWSNEDLHATVSDHAGGDKCAGAEDGRFSVDISAGGGGFLPPCRLGGCSSHAV